LAGDDRQRDPVAARPEPDAAPRVTRTEVVALSDADLAQIHDLRTRGRDFFVEVGDPPPTPQSFQADLDDLPEGFTRQDEVIYRAYLGAGVVGYAEVLHGFALAEQWMIGIALVDTALRGGGIGKALVTAIVEDARAAGIVSLVAGVIATRKRSLAFWAREGFTTEVRRRPIVVGGVYTEVVRLERRI
jgi:GNAT superfamily N-acetyltransferase